MTVDSVQSGPIIRADWLEELGLEVPQTIDDWTNVLTAFKEQKGAQAPLTFSGLPPISCRSPARSTPLRITIWMRAW